MSTQTLYTTLETRVIGMLMENTGIDMCDSGGVDGRGWQQRAYIKDWNAVPACDIDVWGDEVIISYDTYNYLKNFLSNTDESDMYDSLLSEIVADNSDDYPSERIKTFMDHLELDKQSECINTYNYDNILSDILQYTIFYTDDKTYIIIQTHNGADARGGYSTPRVFALDDVEYFTLAQVDVYAACDCTQYSSDDGGYYFYTGDPHDFSDAWIYEQCDNTVKCSKCDSLVHFSVIESY